MALLGYQDKPSARNRSAPFTVAVITVLILLASFPQSHAEAPTQGSHSTGGLSLSPRETAPRPASMGLAAAPDVTALQGAPSPIYDEQLGTTFTQIFRTLMYNVTALAQSDADGFGPGYLLNGLTPGGYWYQVGVSYHWPNSDGSYYPGFGFSYQVYGPSGKSVYPSDGAGLDAFSGVVNSGDSVLLSLTFAGSSVLMMAKDWNTGAFAETSYSSGGDSAFVGDTFSSVNSNGFFSGLMTEWYHTAAYFGNEGPVTYTNSAVALTSAWMWIDEFNGATNAPALFNNQTQGPVTFANDQQAFPFAADGAAMSISAHRFVTGLSAASSTLTLTPAIAETSSPAFSASYFLGGEPQIAVVHPGANVLEADSGASLTVSIDSSGSSALDRWVFNGTSGSEVTFAAGTNATYVYYHLVQETVSYQVAGMGSLIPASSAPELTYEVPPAVASATVAPVTHTQAIGTFPVTIFAVAGSSASVNGTIAGGTDHRWEASTQKWTVSTPKSIPDPIEYYEQYQINVNYFVPPETPQTGPPPAGSGKPGTLPPEPPEITSTFLGSQVTLPLLANQSLFWFDAGSHYSWTPVINGSTLKERWIAQGNATSISTISASNAAPNTVILLVYVHQYYAALAVNNQDGGSISYKVAAPFEAGNSVGTGSTWIPAGSNLSASASSNTKWQFESWSGSGSGVYTGASPSIDVTVTGPLIENATFFPQLVISADGGTNVAFSYGSHTGTVEAGTTKTLYVPPSTNVTLRATSSLFVYSFASWSGTGVAKATRPSLSLVVDSPSAVTGTSSYDYPVVLGAAVAAAIVIILAVSLLVRSRRRREQIYGFSPSYP